MADDHLDLGPSGVWRVAVRDRAGRRRRQRRHAGHNVGDNRRPPVGAGAVRRRNAAQVPLQRVVEDRDPQLEREHRTEHQLHDQSGPGGTGCRRSQLECAPYRPTWLSSTRKAPSAAGECRRPRSRRDAKREGRRGVLSQARRDDRDLRGLEQLGGDDRHDQLPVPRPDGRQLAFTINTTGFPTTAHVRLATVAAGATTITSIADAQGLAYTVLGTFADGVNLTFGTSTGTQLGTAASQKLGFYGKTPIIQPMMGAATAGSSYTSTEQGMLNAVYAAVRALGLGS